MKHFHDITVTPANIATNPVIYRFQIDKGLITECGVYFVRGCHGVVNVKIFFQAHQILPRNQESWMHGDDGWWTGKMYFPVTAAPLTIKVIAYEWDDIADVAAGYNHTITVCLELTPWNQVPSWDKLIMVLERIAKMFGVTIPPRPVTEMTP